MDAQIIQTATQKLKRKLGVLAYLYGAAKGGRRKPYAFRVLVDENPPVMIKGLAAGITNLGTLAGNVRPLKSVSVRNGMLDAIIISPENFLDACRMTWFSMLGRLNEDPRVKHFRGKRVRIECFPEAPLEMDGDGLGFVHVALILTRPAECFTTGSNLQPGKVDLSRFKNGSKFVGEVVAHDRDKPHRDILRSGECKIDR